MTAILTDQDIASLAATHDIIALGMKADEVRRQRHGLRTTFVRVAVVPLPTTPSSPDGNHDPSIDTEPAAAMPSWPAAAGELRIVGRPTSLRAAADAVRAIAPRARGVPISGFSLSDLEHLAATEQVTLRALLEALGAAGLELVASADFDRLQDPRRSIEEVNIAGLSLARLTIDQLPAQDVTELYKDIVALQRRVAVIRAFAPLPRKPNPAVPTTGYDDVKRVALARLIIDNVPSIQVDWSLYGPKLAQVALTIGADDVDGVSAENETSEGRRRAPLEEIRRNIRSAGQDPVERNGRFEVIAGGAADPRPRTS